MNAWRLVVSTWLTIVILVLLHMFLSFIPTRFCTMTQTVTAPNWTILAAQNRASPQATGENRTLGNGLWRHRSLLQNNEYTHKLQRQEEETDHLCSPSHHQTLVFKIWLKTSCSVPFGLDRRVPEWGEPWLRLPTIIFTRTFQRCQLRAISSDSLLSSRDIWSERVSCCFLSCLMTTL